MKRTLLACLLASLFAVGCSDDDTNTPTPDGAPPADMAQHDGTTPTPDSGPQQDTGTTDTGITDTTAADAGPTWRDEFSIDMIILYDWSWLTRVTTTNGVVWLPTSPRANAVVYFAEAASWNAYEKISDTTLLFNGGGGSAYGEQGPATEYKLKSAVQDVTFSWDDQAGFGYNPPFGLDNGVGTKAYDDPDTIEFSTTGSVTETASFAAPAALDPATFLTAGNGFANEISLADGSFDMVIVKLNLKGGTYGQHLLRYIRAADMTLDNGMRKAPIMDSDALTAAAAKGLTPDEPTGAMASDTLTITVVTEKVVDNIGPGGRSIPVYAGQRYQMKEPVIQLAKP